MDGNPLGAMIVVTLLVNGLVVVVAFGLGHGMPVTGYPNLNGTLYSLLGIVGFGAIGWAVTALWAKWSERKILQGAHNVSVGATGVLAIIWALGIMLLLLGGFLMAMTPSAAWLFQR